VQLELIYENTCPNVEAARSQLLRAFAEAGVQPRWREWEISSPEAPRHVHGYGSPTILVNGRDVSGDAAGGDDYCCRIYSYGDQGSKGVPPLADIVRALESGRDATPSKGSGFRWQLNGPALPAVGAAFLPKLACPACWPAYTALLSSFGIGFLDYTPYLMPLTIVSVVVAAAALAYRAKQRRGYKPFLFGLLAGVILLGGKFHFDSDTTMYAGLVLLVLASLWNAWPKARAAGAPCPACITSGRETARQT